jgi:predicted phage-related endonuclease
MNKYTKIKDFHGERAKGVGSSDIPILSGLSRRYKATTYTLWEQKTGRAEPWAGNERTRVGKDLEAYTLARFVEEKFGEDEADKFYMSALRERSYGPFKAKTEARHPDRRYCLAHADLLVDGAPPSVYSYVPVSEIVRAEFNEETRTWGPCGEFVEPFIVEAKTVGLMASKRREGQIFTGYDITGNKTAQDIPDSVFLQVQWQLYCYDIRTAWVAALIDNQYHTFGPIVADPRVQGKCLALAERFWQLVEADTPPAPETWDDVQALWPHQANTTAMIAGDDEAKVREMIARDKALAERVKSIDEERDEIKNAIGILLGENSVLASAEGDVLAKSSETTRESVSLSKIRKSMPQIATELEQAGIITTSTYRTVRF